MGVYRSGQRVLRGVGSLRKIPASLLKRLNIQLREGGKRKIDSLGAGFGQKLQDPTSLSEPGVGHTARPYVPPSAAAGSGLESVALGAQRTFYSFMRRHRPNRYALKPGEAQSKKQAKAEKAENALTYMRKGKPLGDAQRDELLERPLSKEDRHNLWEYLDHRAKCLQTKAPSYHLADLDTQISEADLILSRSESLEGVPQALLDQAFGIARTTQGPALNVDAVFAPIEAKLGDPEVTATAEDIDQAKRSLQYLCTSDTERAREDAHYVDYADVKSAANQTEMRRIDLQIIDRCAESWHPPVRTLAKFLLVGSNRGGDHFNGRLGYPRGMVLTGKEADYAKAVQAYEEASKTVFGSARKLLYGMGDDNLLPEENEKLRNQLNDLQQRAQGVNDAADKLDTPYDPLGSVSKQIQERTKKANALLAMLYGDTTLTPKDPKLQDFYERTKKDKDVKPLPERMMASKGDSKVGTGASIEGWHLIQGQIQRTSRQIDLSSVSAQTMLDTATLLKDGSYKKLPEGHPLNQKDFWGIKVAVEHDSNGKPVKVTFKTGGTDPEAANRLEKLANAMKQWQAQRDKETHQVTVKGKAENATATASATAEPSTTGHDETTTGAPTTTTGDTPEEAGEERPGGPGASGR